MPETYSRWDPVGGITTPCAQVDIECGPALVITLRFSYMTDGLDTDLRIGFGTEFMAFMSHDEFAHPWAGYSEEMAGHPPKLDGRWEPYTFPVLEVESSLWLKSFSESQILNFQRARLKHYRFVSLDNTVDVLAQGVPEVSWIEGASSDAVEGNGG